ncbi:MAG: SRPBCC family protein [Rubrobacteraceae bacterium]
MKIQNEFTVEAPLDEAWEAILDLERVAPCLPGAAITEQNGDEYKGTMTVKIGPINAKYEGTVKYEETDEEARRAVLKANGRDARGQGTASATITSTMEERDEGTKVNVETDMKLTGRAAQFGRGIQQDVAAKLLEQFAECLERRLGGEEPEALAGVAEEQSGEGAPKTNGAGQRATAASANGSPEGEAAEEKPKSRKISQPEPEPLDLGEMSQEAVMKRVKPVLIGAGALLVVLLIVRGLRRR